MTTDSTGAVPGPFRYEDFKVLDAKGRIVARLHMSARIPTDALNATGKLLAASWDLKQLLGHVLQCSGTPADCDICEKVAAHVEPEKHK